MPLIIEALPSTPDDADAADLRRILGEDWQCPVNAELRVGRFNGRLLAAAVFQRDGTVWQFRQIAVRDITRRRGVGRRLLEVLQEEARAAGATLQVRAGESGGEAGDAFLRVLGFTPADGCWHWP